MLNRAELYLFNYFSGFLLAYLYYKDEKKMKQNEKSMTKLKSLILNTQRFFLMVLKRFVRYKPHLQLK